MPKPVIAINVSFYPIEKMTRSVVGSAYTDMVQRVGGIPFLIPPQTDNAHLDRLLEFADGFVTVGGYDVDPRRYGADPVPAMKNFTIQDPRRAENDFGLLERTLAKRIPTLAICLGLQQLNIIRGGSLYQDIPTRISNPLVHKIKEWYDARHEVEFERGSLLHKLTGACRTETNSAHHQCVNTVGRGFHVAGWTSDNVVEALEPDDPALPVLGVQWHPEFEPNELVGERLFEWLVTTIQKGRPESILA